MSTPTTNMADVWGGGIEDASSQAVDLVKDNALLLLAMPLIWVGYRVTKKVVSKIGG